MEKELLIEKFSKALYNGQGAVFAGAGISAPSCEIDWFGLIKPFADELGIQLNNETDDLTLIAQYIVNSSYGNRGPLINEITECLTKNYPLNEYHAALSLTNLSSIWTTNYDILLEQAFRDFQLDVKINDSAISKNAQSSAIEIIKMHGCIKNSSHDDIVITQQDYEDYFIRRPATAQRLRNDLLKKSFLFIGYSYRDPNINNIMVEVRRLAQNAPREHFMIIPKNKNDNEKIKRQELWCKNLKRMGISCVLIDNSNELKDILFSISQKSRGKTVYVTGSHKRGSHTATAIGQQLADIKDVVLISGQSSGISSDVVSAFTEACVIGKIDITNRLHIFPNPYAAKPEFSDDISLIPQLKQWRSGLLRSTQVVIIFDGGIGTKAEVEVAKGLKCKIIPVVTKEDGQISSMMSELINDLETKRFLTSIDNEYYAKIKNGCVEAKDVIACVKKALK